MKTRKGPYGYFAVFEKDNMQPVYNYALDIIENTSQEGLLKAFDEEKRSGLEISYDFSGLFSISEKDIINTDKNTKRKAIGDLFLNMIGLMDILLPPDRIVLNPDYIFYDTNEAKLKICYIPIITEYDNEISSLGAQRLEELLDHPFFSSSLSGDESSALIYSVKANDENMFKETLESIKKPVKESNSHGKDTALILMILVSLAVLIVSTFLLDKIFTYILGTVFIGLMIKILIDRKRSGKNEQTDDLKNERTKILFDNEPEETETYEDLFSFASLESLEDKSAYGLYARETKIGSDRFLSDIHIEDPKVSSLQAILTHEDNSFFITDCSQRNNTYLEDRALIKDKKYEIKNGQKITFGEKSFVFRAN